MVEEIYLHNIDKNLPLVIFTIGSSGQGKTTYSNKIQIRRGDLITSPKVYHWDNIRASVRRTSNNLCEHKKKVLNVILHEIVQSIDKHEDVVFDDLNSSYDKLKEVKQILKGTPCSYIGIFFKKSIEEVLSNNRNKPSPFPDDMIKHMHKSNSPLKESDFDFTINVTSNSDYDTHLFII